MARDNTGDLEHQGGHFSLVIDGVEMARFTGISGLSWEAKVVEHEYSSDTGVLMTEKRPGRITYDPIVLKRGLSVNPSFTAWCEAVQSGSFERKTGAISIYARDGAELEKWSFDEGWPSKWSAADLDAGSDDVLIEELTIVHEKLVRGDL